MKRNFFGLSFSLRDRMQKLCNLFWTKLLDNRKWCNKDHCFLTVILTASDLT